MILELTTQNLDLRLKVWDLQKLELLHIMKTSDKVTRQGNTQTLIALNNSGLLAWADGGLTQPGLMEV